MDRVIARARASDGDVALFAHGHVLRVLAARWIGPSGGRRRTFMLDTGTCACLEMMIIRDIPAVQVWNGTLIGSARRSRREVETGDGSKYIVPRADPVGSA